MSEILAGNLVHFVRYLRAIGLGVVPTTTNDLLLAAESIGWDQRDDLYLAFRSLAVARPSELAAFDEAFELFFGDGSRRRPTLDQVELRMWDQATLSAVMPVLQDGIAPDPEAESQDVEQHVGGSAVERLSRKDFEDLTPEERAEVQKLMARMIWEPADARSRRYGPASGGRRPDMRRTLRRLSGPEGDLIPLAFSDPGHRKRPLVVIADISGSMEKYAEMFMYFIHAAQGRLGRVEAFVFSTQLTRITREIRHRNPSTALSQVSNTVFDWSGGTKIGEALRDFNWNWGRRVTRGGAVGLVISDGWDCGDPAVLAEEMARFARAMHRVIWLNPLAGRDGYAPLTRGMRTVLPHVDHFLPAGNLTDLRSLIGILESVPAKRRPA